MLNIRDQPVPNLARKVAGTVLLIEGSMPNSNMDPSTSTPGKVLIVKRIRQDGREEVEDMDQSLEAASYVEGRQA